MIEKINRALLLEHGCTLSGNIAQLDVRESRLEPPFVFSGNLAPSHVLRIGSFTYTQGGAFVNVELGRYCSIAEEVAIGANSHPTDWLSTAPFQYRQDPWGWASFGKRFDSDLTSNRKVKAYNNSAPTKVGNDVWIGRKAIIKAGVTIGNGAIIGAGAVVTKNVPAYAIVAGSPAKIIRFRFSSDLIEKLEALRWWQYPLWQLSDIPFNNPDEAVLIISEMALTGTLKAYQPETISQFS